MSTMDAQEHAIVLADTSTSASPQDVPSDVASYLADMDGADLTDAQRRYLLARLAVGNTRQAALMAGVKGDTVERTWRIGNDLFKALERRATELANDAKVQLARALAMAATPMVVQRQVEQATESHAGRSDRQLMAQQRARESVLKIAGAEQAAPQGEAPAMDEMALLVWRRLRPAQER